MKRQVLIALIATSFTLGACTTLDPYTGEKKISKATTGAAIGALTGALLGNVTSRDKDRRERQKRTLIGAGIGALAGGAVGNYMDRQEMELRQQLEGTGVSVIRDGDNLVLNMPGNLTFAVNNDTVAPNFYEVLNSVGLVLKKYEKTAIEIAGHTDSTGTNQLNQSLSERRARSVGAYLQSQGIPNVRIQTVGFGESRPIADNTSSGGRAANRRVELTLIPLTQG